MSVCRGQMLCLKIAYAGDCYPTRQPRTRGLQG